MATIKIYSEITTSNEANALRMMGFDGISYQDIDEFIGGIDEKDGEIEVRLHCEGGLVTEGWAIYDRLRASGKDITVVVDGLAASMATVIMMAAPKERRKAYGNATILVHNPYKLPMMFGDRKLTADVLRKEAEELQNDQDRILNLYVERCGCERDEMQKVMDNDKIISVERAKELGLIGEIIAPVSASAANVESNMCKMETKEVKVSILDKMLAKLGLKSLDEVEDVEQSECEAEVETVCMELSTAEGGTLTVERESGEPQVGDKAQPDGEHEMPDGRVIVVKDGVIEEIRPAEEEEKEDEPEDETAALREEIETLRAQLEEAQKMAKSKDEMRILNAVKMAGGEKALKAFKSGYKADKRKSDGRDAMARAEERAEMSPMRREIEARKKGEWKKS